MAILAVCQTCKREGGYAQLSTDVDCFRCKLKNRDRVNAEKKDEVKE